MKADPNFSVQRSTFGVQRLPDSASAADADNPWPGLATFTEEQSNLFHGRDEEIRDLTRRAERNALTVLFGQSGLGKSSLLQAGVFPRLRAASFWPIYVRLDHGPGAPTPTEQIKAFVAADTVRAGTWTKPGSAKPGETLWEFFHHRDDRLVGANGKTIVPVLVLDQFEELFTLGAGGGAERARAVAFMSELAELVENRPSEQLVARLEESSAEMEAFDFSRTDYRVVISLREDFLPHLESLKTIMPALMENRMRLARMTGTQALQAVVKPGGALVTEEVARAIVEFVAGARGGSAERLAELDVEPPLLSVICRELNERRRALGQAQITADLVSGNRREILTDFYERSVGDLPEPVRLFVEDRLLTKSGFRDNLALETALESPGVTQPLLDTLVSRRLVRIEDRLGVQRVELTHDVLAEVIRGSRDTRQQRLALEQARDLERRAHRRVWVLRGIAAVLTVLLGGASWIAWRSVQTQRAEAQTAARRASRTDFTLATGLFDQGKATEAIAYLVRAARSDPHNAVVGPRLLSALATRKFLVPEGAPLQLPAGAAVISYTPDGAEIFVLSDNGIIRALDPTGERIVREFSFPQKVLSFAFAQDNSRIFTARFEDNTILICDTATGNPVAPPIRPLRPVGGQGYPRLSPDGRWLAAGSQREVWLWETATGELRATLPLNRDVVASINFSPDSQRIATCTWLDFRVWSVPDGAPVTPDLHTKPITNVYNALFSPDNRLIAVGLRGGVELRDATTGAQIGPRLPIEDITTGLLFTPDGKRLIASGTDPFVRVWDVSTGELAFSPLASGSGVGNYNALSRDGRVLLTKSLDGFSRVWDMATGKSLAEPALQQDRLPRSILSPDGTRLLIGTRTGALFRLSLARGATRPLALVLPSVPVGSNVGQNRTKFLPDPPLRLRAITAERTIVFDAASGREVAGGMLFLKRFWSDTVRPDGRFMVGWTGGAKDPWETELWESGRAGLRVVPLPEMVPKAVFFAFSKTGNLLLAVGDSSKVARAEIHAWDLSTAKLAGPPITYDSPISFSARGEFSPDGKRLAAATLDSTARVWDIATGKLLLDLKPLPAGEVSTMTFSPDGTRIATASRGGEARLWDAATGAPVSPILNHRGLVHSAVFSRDGRYLSTKTTNTVDVWDARNGHPIGKQITEVGTLSDFVSAPFNDAGKRLLTAAVDGTVRLWDARTGLPLAEPMKHDSGVNVTFSPGDGRFMLGSARRGIYIWALPPDIGEASTPDWLLRLATVCAGKRVTAEGTILDATDEVARIEDLRHAVAALPDDAPFAAWGKWFFADPATRPIAPGFTVTSAEAEKLAKEMSPAVP